VMICAGDAAPLFVETLAARGVHVRDKSKDPATPGCIRVTAGIPEHTDAAIAALESAVVRRQN
jgi:histidinol-phosphate/aromatic aminotransferase/cobyric acid decarboxylase-like protein